MFTICKENLLITFKVMEISCSICTTTKCSPAGFPVLVILIFFFFGIRIVWVFLHNPHPPCFHWKKSNGERHNKSQSNQCMQRTTLLRVTHPPHTHSILHSNLIIITVWERGPSCLEVANLRSSYFRPESAISTHPERQQLVLSPTFNSFRKLNSILTLPPTSVNLHNTTQKSTNSEIKYSHKTRRAVESDLSFQVKNYSYNIVIFCKQHSKKQSLGGLLTCI